MSPFEVSKWVLQMSWVDKITYHIRSRSPRVYKYVFYCGWTHNAASCNLYVFRKTRPLMHETSITVDCGRAGKPVCVCMVCVCVWHVCTCMMLAPYLNLTHGRSTRVHLAGRKSPRSSVILRPISKFQSSACASQRVDYIYPYGERLHGCLCS